jgi:hypothetical protein
MVSACPSCQNETSAPSSTSRSAQSKSIDSASAKNFTLVWSDEFNGPNSSAPDPKKWTYDLGGGGWGNNELETYTNRAENAHVENGNLVITARKEN